MRQILPITMSIAFVGDNPKDLINSCPEMYNAVWHYCGGIADSNINVYMQERLNNEQLEWALSVTTTSGRRSIRAVQNFGSGAVRFVTD